ncbi:hypothetical protein C0Q88_21990 [Ralstonia pickettii]|uniref:Uncharacterized protein n=1 Tax=Ralstonia pickettii TaxID=329 RepID=A0A2N4TLA9_RALPI|nr:hypothetical protein [Ralstonia pickettii]PLC40478.1 hypothetical protein C0Q88_21990 [Ralstonia pickettii]
MVSKDEALKQFEDQLLHAEHVLNTEYSFDLAEPDYLRCLELINGAPELQAQFEDTLIALFSNGRVSDEPLAYLMHRLRWPKVHDWAAEQLRAMPNPLADGASLEKVLNSYSDGWKNRGFYRGI